MDYFQGRLGDYQSPSRLTASINSIRLVMFFGLIYVIVVLRLNRMNLLACYHHI